MDIEYKKDFYIDFHESNFRGEVSLYNVVNYIQQTVEIHSREIGIDFDAMNSKDLFWVVSRLKINMDKTPKKADNIRIKTIMSGLDKLFFKRRFEIIDDNNCIVGRALVYYLIIDKKTRFPQRPTVCPVDILNIQDSENSKLEKIKINGNLVFQKNRDIYYNDLDLNGHVNNANYVKFIEDLFPISWHKKNIISGIQVNFVKEISEGQIIEINAYEETSHTYCIEGCSKEKNIVFFQGRVFFKKL